MPSINQVVLAGNLTRDPEQRTLPSGSTVVEFGLAVNRFWKDRESGERHEEAHFFNVTVFGRSGDAVMRYLERGAPALITGRLRFSRWETSEGERRSKVDVVADRVQFLSRGAGASRPHTWDMGAREMGAKEMGAREMGAEPAFATGGNPGDGVGSQMGMPAPATIGDDDVPF